MRRFFHLMIVAIVALTACCACSKVNDIDKRLGVLENIVSDLKAQISAGAVITSVDKTSDGCTFTLSNGQTYTVTNGKDGADGTDGEAIIADVKIEEDFVVLTLKNGETLRISYQNPLSMVTMSIVPDYDDGTVREPNTTEFNGEKSTIFCLDVAVTPARYAENLSDTERFIHKAVFSPVLTKSDFGNAFTVSPKSVIYAEGAPIPFLEASFELDEETVAALESTPYTVSYSIEDKDKVHGASTAFVPLNNETHSGWISSDDLANGGMAIEVGGHQVTVKLADDPGLADDVMTNLKADGNSVIIRALSYAGKHLKCTLTGDEFCPQSKNANMAYTFTLSDIASEITATIGYAKEVTITKFVTPEGSGTINVTGDCYEGETVTLTAIEDYDYYSFVEWQDAGGEKLDWTDSQDITLTSDHLTVKAIYRNNSVLPGIFTVNESDKKVQFSKGNLYFNGGYDGSNKYCLEKKQYDVPPLTIKTDLMNETESHVGHFYWSSNAERARSLSNYSDADASEGDEFFANHPDSFEVNRLKGWSVLTGNPGGEWEYLLNTRKTIYGTGILSENNRRYAAVKVNSINGLLIFPDEFSWPAGAGDEPQTFNTFSNDWNGLNYTETQFAALQTAGCVFLPVAGYREGNPQRSETMSVNQPVALGCYWSASPINYSLAYVLVFQKDEVSLFGLPRFQAYAVRLVTEVK